MCRFLIYSGPASTMAPLLFNTENSLVEQSKSAKQRAEPVNGDGFGIGWYPHHEDPYPGIFKSIEPAWSNKNLRFISTKVLTRHFFAHVRDATGGTSVAQNNCHPFHFGRLLWMHNGHVAQFELIRRKLLAQLSDQAFQMVTGNTDSEHVFALFLDNLGFDDNANARTLKHALKQTVHQLKQMLADQGIQAESLFNFALTNGEQTLVMRYVDNKDSNAASLYYAQGELKPGEGGLYQIESSSCAKTDATADTSTKSAIFVASEPLTSCSSWQKINEQCIVSIDALTLTTEEISAW